MITDTPQLRLQIAEISVKEIVGPFLHPSQRQPHSVLSHISDPLYPPMTSPQGTTGIKRTRTGCWTCRTRRKKCDEGRPFCQACQVLGLVCEGYGVRLKWAIRGRPCVTVRHVPLRKVRLSAVESSVEAQNTHILRPDTVVGECERESDQVLLQHLGWDVYASLSKFERDVLYDFADWGALTLFSKPATETTPDPGRFREALGYCAQSKLMLLNSLTYQITQDPKRASHVDEYYGHSIRAFRHTLSDPVRFNEDMTPYAGVLLCSISMNRAMPFSIHLNGIASIFHDRHLLQPPNDDSRELADLIGVLDLPTYSLGRQNKHLHMWHKYCMGRSGVEEVTGLPRSLIDLLASAMDDDIEERLLRWSCEPNEPVMCKIWEATQYAGLILIREYRVAHGLPLRPKTQSTASVVEHVLTLLQELRTGMDISVFGTIQAFLKPLVAVGSQPKSLTADDRAFIKECIVTLAGGSLSSYPYYEAVVIVLETLWASDGMHSLDHVVRELNFELGLF